MNPDFWHARWREGRIGFHKTEVNTHLMANLDHLGAPRDLEGAPTRGDAAVFVPLCGKSVDLAYLVTRGFRVVGVELSELACRTMFAEQAIPFVERRAGGYLRFEAGSLTVLCGDYFALEASDLGPLGAAWDRAALIAMPPERRAAYVATMTRLLPPGAPLLLVSLTYHPEGAMQGPPFSVPDAEVRTLYGDAFRIDSSIDHDALDDQPRFRESGLTSLHETVYRARRA